MNLKRARSTPILLPDPASQWETYNVFNPSVIYANGLFHMHYRAQGLDWISRIGYAVSEDGLEWNRLRHPVLEPIDARESRGVEDPRVTEIEGTYYMAYTAYGSSGPEAFRITPMVARSRNLITWERIAPLVVGEDNKDHVLFPRKINGRYVSLHRRAPQIWIAESENLVHWPEEWMRPIFGPRPGNGWDEKRVGGNGVPIETEHGWLMLYHAYNNDHVYRIGACMLDLDNPARVLNRPKDSIFEPQELWELRGDVPNVVFSNANPVVGDTVYVYYGAADHVIGLATCKLADLVDHALNG
jgi:beta-1,2-mannobiose phosphorylase / 1,2-beta-oligomannan phosphorylase